VLLLEIHLLTIRRHAPPDWYCRIKWRNPRSRL